ncbi:WYL domain-containing protein [Verrucomicrobiaceae bacterium R5-34]|uniref:WYL domain-containing protein n=1 Tax=Oceaniferula flava TaxID=2800421 RepID=A0AAE2SDU5_9BACT|nr:WYL domain-containing protein [Oceaniferula flavus]MBK1830614.1 WYL domain-containing protein [Verrucomicrobiaceae bacterium R5-34]MBK1854710.1 WYL domain-containing protein [Oceaniferula flavus]MBM1136016.1 WYL domain-containing protein [Oceaniferula flavus]
MRAIEKAVWWRGWIGRGDLAEIFGISRAQASSDLQKFQELNPGALVYQMSRKRYEGPPEMRCVLHEPRLEEGMAAFLGDRSTAAVSLGNTVNSVARVDLPQRKGKDLVERALLMAVAEGLKLRVRYWSVNSGKASWRYLAPHAFGHDGYRWHVRAWCYEREAYLDFVLGRMEKTDWPEPHDSVLPEDQGWQETVTVKLKPNSALNDPAKRAIEMDYGIRKNGQLTIKVRQAMERYLLEHLRIGHDGGELPRHFERV